MRVSSPPADRSTQTLGASKPGVSKLAVLFALYVVEGLPFGFQAKALPVFLRSEGVSLAAVGFAGMLALPWLLKPLWAPWIEHLRMRFGYRAVLIPNQIAIAAMALLSSGFDPSRALLPLLACIFAMNLFAATLDIVVDGLAINLLTERELGLGNSAQVVGYKVGMLTAGGLLVWASDWIGFRGLFVSVAALALLSLLASAHPLVGVASSEAGETMGARAILRTLWDTVTAPRHGWLLLVAATYKIGEAMADAMFKPFLVDEGFTPGQIGLWVGSVGGACSIAGSLLGGLIVSKLGVWRGLFWCAVARVFPVLAQAALAAFGATLPSMIATTAFEHLCGGAVTTAMFAAMMFGANRAIGGAHYTALAAVEVFGKSPGAWASGILAASLGYPALFLLAAVLSALFLPLLSAAMPRLAQRDLTRPDQVRNTST